MNIFKELSAADVLLSASGEGLMKIEQNHLTIIDNLPKGCQTKAENPQPHQTQKAQVLQYMVAMVINHANIKRA